MPAAGCVDALHYFAGGIINYPFVLLLFFLFITRALYVHPNYCECVNVRAVYLYKQYNC